MTKKEQAEMADMKERLAMALALSWPPYRKPERVDTSLIGWGELVTGWFQNNYGAEYSVTKGCSNGVHHDRSRTDKTSTQLAGCFYKSKTAALQVARIEMTERFAKVLAKIDADIAKAEADI